MSRQVTTPDETTETLRNWYDDGLLGNLVVLRGSRIGWLFGIFGQHAVTVNGTVHLTSDAPALDVESGIVLLGHECFHVEQQRDLGWLKFLARYVWLWRPWHVRSGRDHPMEKPAYGRGDEIRNVLRGRRAPER